MSIGRIILCLIVVWVLWASFSRSGLYTLKQINPDYQVENKHLAYLISKFVYSDTHGFWDRYFVESCSLYMPNWEKAQECVDARITCQSVAPRDHSLPREV